MPPGTVSVSRPGPFGSPFQFSSAEQAGYTRQDAIAAFEDWLNGSPWACPSGDAYEARRHALLARLPDLRGRNLACWCRLCARHKNGKPFDEYCPDCAPCHADVLGRIATLP